jgi:hypothetical protein
LADLAAIGRDIVDAQSYLTLGTADEAGLPWVSPVWYAPDGYSEFLWVSDPDARHSRNLAARPQVSIVIFDSRAPIGTGRGVYMSAVAGQDERGIEVFSRRSISQGGAAWTLDDVRAPSRLRLYRAVASEQFVLTAGDDRVPVNLELD